MRKGKSGSVTLHLFLAIVCALVQIGVQAQSLPVDESQAGAWYMYFWSTQVADNGIGFQGDLQFRNWDLGSDLEQLLLRGGLAYVPKGTNVKFTLGYGFVMSGAYGSDDATSTESRVYQEALVPQKLASRVYLNHRFRFEQRWVEGQDFRIRWRYALFLNVALNKTQLGKGTFYYAFYDELFINGQRNIGGGRTVKAFDRNRFYNALGYGLTQGLRIQAGYMVQTTDSLNKGQVQLSLHHSF